MGIKYTGKNIIEKLPSVKIGLDDFYGKQTVIKALEQQNDMNFDLTIVVHDLRAIIRANRNSSESGLKQTDWIVKWQYLQ